MNRSVTACKAPSSTHRLARAAFLAAWGLGAAGAQAQATLDRYAPPNNMAVVGLSGQGLMGVGATQGGNQLLNSTTGSFTPIGGNSASSGFSGSLGISGNGAIVSGGATAPNGYNQAARYDVATGTWTTLGSLGVNSTTVTNGIQTQSLAYAMSSDGSTVGGSAYYNATGTGSGTASHPVVFRNGAVIDLNPAGGNQSGRVQSISGDGSVLGGYVSNSAVGSIWTWNGTSYVAAPSPKAPHPTTGALVSIQAAQISDNGVWAAGGSVNGLAINYAPFGQQPSNTYSPATLWNTQTQTGLLIPFDHAINTGTTGNLDVISNMKASIAGVSNNGVVIGTFDQCLGCATGALQQDAWIYFAATHQTLSFDAYLASLGLALTPTQHVWSLHDMSADGSSISGIYFDSAVGQSTSFVLRGITAAVPEPSAWLLLACGLPLMWLRRVKATAAGR